MLVFSGTLIAVAQHLLYYNNLFNISKPTVGYTRIAGIEGRAGQQRFRPRRINMTTREHLQTLERHCGLSFLIAVALMMTSSPAYAAGYITSGSERASEGGTVGVATGTNLQVYLEAGRSYACTAIPGDTSTQLALDNVVQGPSNDIVAQTRGHFTPVVTAPTIAASQNMRLVLTPQETGLHTFRVETANGTEIIRPECLETTLYGGYNTNVNDFNFLEITNISNQDIVVKVTAVNFDGTVVINGLTQTVPAGRRVDIDVHSAAGNNVFGGIMVTHDGPYGALQANVSQYAGTVADFSLSTSTPLRPRDQAF